MKIPAIAVVLALFFPHACEKMGVGNDKREGYSYRYRLTISVRENGKLETASNVVQVTEYPALSSEEYGCRPWGCLASTAICGEATVLPLRNGRYLLALFKGSAVSPGEIGWRGSPTMVMLERLGLNTHWTQDQSGISQLARGSKEIVLTEHKDMPEFVVVRDKDKPLSFTRSAWPSDDPEWLGDGIFFSSLTIQTTTDPVTTGQIEKAFPWLSSYDDEYRAHRHSTGPIQMGFKRAEFARCDHF